MSWNKNGSLVPHLPYIFHDTIRRKKDVKLGSDTAIVASASQCGPRITCKSSCCPRSNLSLRHWCRGRHICGCSKEFCPNYPILFETNPTNVTSKTKLFNLGANCFQIKACWAPFLLKFSGFSQIFENFAFKSNHLGPFLLKF